jgi:hypothetical protein
MSNLRSLLSGSVKEYLADKSAVLERKEKAAAELKNLQAELYRQESAPIIARYNGRILDIVLPISTEYRESHGLRKGLYSDVKKLIGKEVEEGQFEKEYVSLRVKAGKRSVKRIFTAVKKLSQKYEKEFGIQLDVEDLSMGIFVPRAYEPVSEAVEKPLEKTFDRKEVVRDIANGLSQSDVVTKYQAQGFTRGDYLDLRKKLKVGKYKGLFRQKKERQTSDLADAAKARLIAKLKTYKTKPSKNDWEAIKKEYGIGGKSLWGLYLSNVIQGKHK